MRRTQLKFARQSLYNLKRRYGVPADLYRIIDSIQNVQTGRMINEKEKYHIKKLIWLPNTILSQMGIPGQFKNPSPDFTSGDIDIETTTFILDQKELPSSFQLNSDDYLIVKREVNRISRASKRYNIRKFIELEDGIGYLIYARYLVGGQRNEIFDKDIHEILTIVEVKDFELN